MSATPEQKTWSNHFDLKDKESIAWKRPVNQRKWQNVQVKNDFFLHTIKLWMPSLMRLVFLPNCSNVLGFVATLNSCHLFSKPPVESQPKKYKPWKRAIGLASKMFTRKYSKLAFRRTCCRRKTSLNWAKNFKNMAVWTQEHRLY